MRVLKWIFGGILLAYLGILLMMAFPGVTRGSLIAVTDKGMGQAAEPGDLVWLRPCAFEELRAGEVIALQDEVSGEVLVRRVAQIDRKNRLLCVQGDAGRAADGWWTAWESTLGRAELRIPYLGYLFVIGESIWGKLLLAAALLWMAALEYILAETARLLQWKKIAKPFICDTLKK